MLTHYLIKSYERNIEQHIHETLRQRCEVMSREDEGSYNWTGIRKALRGKKVDTKVKEALLGLMYRTNPTQHWLWKHGWQTSGMCPYCGQRDDIHHSLEGCGNSTAGEKYVEKYIRAIRLIPAPPMDDARE